MMIVNDVTIKKVKYISIGFLLALLLLLFFCFLCHHYQLTSLIASAKR